MKNRSLVYLLTLLLTFGLVLFSVHSDSENVTDVEPKPTNDVDVETVEPDSTEGALDPESVTEALKKVEQILNLLQGSMEGITELTKDGNISKDGFDNKFNQMVNNLKNIEGVKVTTSSDVKEFDLSEILKNPNDLQGFEKKAKAISEDDNLDEKAKKQKILELMENLELDSSIFPDITKFKDIESQPVDSKEFFNSARDILGIIGKISKLHMEGDLDEDQLAEKMKEMLQDLNVKPVIQSDEDNGTVSIVLGTSGCVHCMNNNGMSDMVESTLKGVNKVSTDRTELSSKTSQETESIGDLEQRVGNLEKKIDTLIEKLSNEPSE